MLEDICTISTDIMTYLHCNHMLLLHQESIRDKTLCHLSIKKHCSASHKLRLDLAKGRRKWYLYSACNPEMRFLTKQVTICVMCEHTIFQSDIHAT